MHPWKEQVGCHRIPLFYQGIKAKEGEGGKRERVFFTHNEILTIRFAEATRDKLKPPPVWRSFSEAGWFKGFGF